MNELSGVLQEAINEGLSIFTTISDWDTRRPGGKWSNLEILGHLIDSAANNIQRFVRATHDSDFKIIYNQDQWVRHQHYNQVSAAELTGLFLALNKQMIRIWMNYPDGFLSKRLDIGQSAPEFKTIYEIAEGYISHLQHHLTQMKEAVN
ncbi:DinB family protein [Dyadobacter sp. CY327]|uniref:DinB family protein n=1 Tax=Dyadobacter sp. CY327 TaxID=2907301 RepID=UPI001F323D03|nr:DinB family protein [Dyadobacter sp. CY327]MCE7072585.1 DinB family protein [Dyadobacter sp. CY327]